MVDGSRNYLIYSRGTTEEGEQTRDQGKSGQPNVEEEDVEE
jgi:hypothetical protein